jgi:hypothetical protein
MEHGVEHKIVRGCASTTNRVESNFEQQIKDFLSYHEWVPLEAEPQK